MRQEDYVARIQELEEALNACRTSKSMLQYLQRKELIEEAKRLFESGAHVGETNAWRQTIIDAALRRRTPASPVPPAGDPKPVEAPSKAPGLDLASPVHPRRPAPP